MGKTNVLMLQRTTKWENKYIKKILKDISFFIFIVFGDLS